MDQPETEVVECDVLIVGGGMSGCGAAYETAFWAKEQGLRTVVVEKAAMERSGAVAMGLSAINCYMGMKWGENTPEDFVRYVRNDLMGLSREDLVYDIARHVDSAVHMFEDWGLPFLKTEEGRYVREGRWQVMIHGESYKPIVSEAAKKAVGNDNVYQRIFISHLLKDRRNPNRIAGAVGFSVRDPKIYVFKARAVVCACGGATNVWRPHAGGRRPGADLVLGLQHGLGLQAHAQRRGGAQPNGAPPGADPFQGRLWAGGDVVPAVQIGRQERLRRAL